MDPGRGAPTPAILVAVGDIAIFGRIIVGGDGRGVATPVGKGPVAAIVAAQHIDVVVRLFIAERRDDPEAVVEIIAEHRRAGGFPAADFAALAHLEVAGGGEAVLKIERVAGLQVDDTAEPAFEERGIGRLEDLDAADQFGRNALEAVVAVIIPLADLIDFEPADEKFAIQQRHILFEAANADLRPLPVFAIDLNPGDRKSTLLN